MRRTGTAAELPVYNGVPVALLPQPDTFTTVTWNSPGLGPPPGGNTWTMKSRRNPMIDTGPLGVLAPS